MKNNFNSLYERFDELYTTYDDRKALKGYIESMSRKSSKDEVEVSADNLPDTILTFVWLMELDMLIRSALSDAQWLIAKGGTDRAETLNRVLGKIGNVLKELDGVYLIDLNKVWHQAKDVMPPRIYGGNHADLLCVHQFKPTSHPILTHERWHY